MSCPHHVHWPYEPERCPWCYPDRLAGYNQATNSDGSPMTIDPAEVEAKTQEAMHDGRVRAVLFELPTGDHAWHIMGPPSYAMVKALEDCARIMRDALRVH